jgi:hypothetical protein
VGAACVIVTLHAVVADAPRLVGVQVTPDSSAAAVVRLTVAVCELVPKVVVTVAV